MQRPCQLFRIVAITGLLLSACAAPPEPAGMTVAAGPSAAPGAASDKTLEVEPVTGGTPTEASQQATLGNDEFHAALVASLKNSGLFREVTTSGNADWRLTALIASQAAHGHWSTTQELMIRYELFRAGVEQPSWSETVYTQHEMGVPDDLAALRRSRLLVETTARENIADFLGRLRRWLATQSSR
jgi:hypothetical protein